MRIGVDARCLEWKEGGPARYLVNMLKLWPEMNQKHEYVLFFQNYIPDFDFLRHERFELVLMKGPGFLKTRRIVGEQVLMPSHIRKSKIDLFFTPWYSAPLAKCCPKKVVGLWDVSAASHPTHYSILEKISFGFFSPVSCRQSDGVITCSAYDARQIVKYYRIPSEKIQVVHYAADDKFQPAEDPAQLENFRRKYNFPLKYILYMGIIITRRNVDVIIDAFSDIQNAFPDVGLVVVGRNATNPYIDIEEKMKPLIEDGRGFYFVRAPEEDVADFYRGAWYYMSTSTTDGESLMLKEAQKCGTPIVTSPLLKETVGGYAVILEDPTDQKQTANVLRRVIPDQALRDQLAEEGKKWMATHSWEKVAQQCLEFMESR
jgi:glycosyltransferase involved in cell wall biosynthesis